MIASGYSIMLQCDACYRSVEFGGDESARELWRGLSKSTGWKISRKYGVCLCPECALEGKKLRDYFEAEK